jgi:nuclear protein localization family protein 4
VTHGFPTNPTPAFLSTTFQIENRPEFGKQDVTAIIRALAQLHAPAIQDSRHGGGKDIVQRKQLLTFLSDWHLLAFLGSVGVLSEVCLG